MNSNNITVTGLVATTPRYLTTQDGNNIISFRLASSERHFDTISQRWVESDTNWFTVTGFGQLAENGAESINKGDRVVVVGALKLRDWENTDRSGTTVELFANILGHDLNWGVGTYKRVSLKEAVNA